MKDIKERRFLSRVSAQYPIKIASNINGKLININQRGAEFVIDKPLLLKQNKANILFAYNQSWEVNFKTIWSQEDLQHNKYIYGVYFINLDLQIENMIKQTILAKSWQPMIERVPYDKELNYEKDFVDKRRDWIEKKVGVKLKNIASFSTESREFRGNIENFIGCAQVPIGIVGPLMIKGEHAKGIFYVPLATTEGAMVDTYQRGAISITKAGGVNVFVRKDQNHLDPIFIFKDINEANDFILWVENNFEQLKTITDTTTHFGKLLRIDSYLLGRRVVLDCIYYTQDAMGANMINIATEALCEFIIKEKKPEDYLLRSNFSSEKKASAVNMLHGYGKEVFVEAMISEKIIKRFLFTTPEKIHSAWDAWILSDATIGLPGFNAQLANGLAGIFIACGQDVAHITNASVGLTTFELTNKGDLYVTLRLPNIIIGTLGGGTALGTQRESLEMIGCYGEGKSKKFAEIIGATLLAGELGICAGVTTKYFLDPHKRARIFTKEKAFLQKKEL